MQIPLLPGNYFDTTIGLKRTDTASVKKNIHLLKLKIYHILTPVMKFKPSAFAIYSLSIVLLSMSFQLLAQMPGNYKAIYNGTPWFDDRGKPVSAHGANIVKDGDRFYLFGEAHTDTSNVFVGFNCYSSADLYNWKFEDVALPQQANGRLGINRVGERPKVLKCPKTGEYIMLIHSDTLGYKDPCIVYATAATITGPYTYGGPLLFDGKPIRKWDMGTYQDDDGAGYLLTHSGNIYKLNDDYKSVTQQVVKEMAPECEAPAVFKKAGVYFWLSSYRTGWGNNDNFYYTATSLYGPWTKRGNFAPLGTLTFNAQTTFVLPIAGAADTTFLFMGDRWSFPRQASAATYVWQPLVVSGLTVALPQYREAWQIDIHTAKVNDVHSPGRTVINSNNKAQVVYNGNWQQSITDTVMVRGADTRDASVTIKFTGTQITLYCLAKPNGGYARLTLRDAKGTVKLNAVIDNYSSYTNLAPKFVSPLLTRNNYTLTLTVMADHTSWAGKNKVLSGSTGNFVYFNKAVVAF